MGSSISPLFASDALTHLARVEDVEIYEDVLSGCAHLKSAGFLLVVVSNQPDVGRGLQTRAAVDQINRTIAAAIPNA